jgi:hypothetical protein
VVSPFPEPNERAASPTTMLTGPTVMITMVPNLPILSRNIYVNRNYKAVKVIYYILIKAAKLVEK